jgi:hypothetical protein
MEKGRFYQQLGERSESGESFGLDKPINLVGNIRTLVRQERAQRTEHFNPAWWLRWKIDVIATEALRQQQPKEKLRFFDDLRVAWQLVAYEEVDGEHNNTL